MRKLKKVFSEKSAIVYLIIFLIGISIMFYPAISSRWNEYLSQKTITQYKESVSLGGDDNERQLAIAEEYNRTLAPVKVPDAFSVKDGIEDKDYEDILNIDGNGAMGYISIPAIDVEIPIYHYSNEESLKKGAGHLLGSTLPVGGDNTHAVISAHRGLPNSKLFRDLNLLEVGDAFYISVAGREMKYEVDQIQVVKPDETESLAREEDKDLVTLVTCTPYGVNTHRLLVRGHRVSNDSDSDDSVKTNTKMIILTILCIAAGVIVAYVVNRILDRRNEKKKKRRS